MRMIFHVAGTYSCRGDFTPLSIVLKIPLIPFQFCNSVILLKNFNNTLAIPRLFDSLSLLRLVARRHFCLCRQRS